MVLGAYFLSMVNSKLLLLCCMALFMLTINLCNCAIDGGCSDTGNPVDAVLAGADPATPALLAGAISGTLLSAFSPARATAFIFWMGISAFPSGFPLDFKISANYPVLKILQLSGSVQAKATGAL